MIKVTLTGLDAVRANFHKASIKARDFSAAWARIGAKVKSDAISMAPVLSGTLKGTVRSSRSKTRATVRAGNNRMEPYAGVIHYGGYNNIQAQPFLTTALNQNEDFAHDEVKNELRRILRGLT